MTIIDARTARQISDVASGYDIEAMWARIKSVADTGQYAFDVPKSELPPRIETLLQGQGYRVYHSCDKSMMTISWLIAK